MYTTYARYYGYVTRILEKQRLLVPHLFLSNQIRTQTREARAFRRWQPTRGNISPSNKVRNFNSLNFSKAGFRLFPLYLHSGCTTAVVSAQNESLSEP